MFLSSVPCVRAKDNIDAPAPLRPEAFQGLAGDFVRLVEPHCEGDPAALLVQFLVVSGTFVGRDGFCLVGRTKHAPNLYAVVVGDSSKGRKGAGFEYVLSCFEWRNSTYIKDCMSYGLSSGEGLIYRVRDPVFKLQQIKGGGEPSVVVDEGVKDKRLCVIEHEFVDVLQVCSRPGNTLSGRLRRGWDGGPLGIMTKNSPYTATDPHIGIIGHITPQELVRALSANDTENGFGNRFLWTYSEKSKDLPRGGSLPPDALDDIRRRIAVAAGCIDWGPSGKPEGIPWECEAGEIWDAFYLGLQFGNDLAGHMTNRAAPQVLRLSLLFALLDCEQTIRLRHLRAALAVWDYCKATAYYLFGGMTGNPLADDILCRLRESESGTATRTEINKWFGKNKSHAVIEQALKYLSVSGSIYKQTSPTKGRSIEYWRLS
jgi:hypothetical protein